MRNSTRHLLPPSPVPVAVLAVAPLTMLLPALPDLPTDDATARQTSTAPATAPGSRQSSMPPAPPPVPTGPSIDVRLEASKIPLDVAVVESILAAGTEDRMKKICQNILIVGGTALIHNVGFAVESR